MEALPDRETDQTVTEISNLVDFSVRLRALIMEEGYTEVSFRNPNTGEVRMLFVTVNAI